MTLAEYGRSNFQPNS